MLALEPRVAFVQVVSYDFFLLNGETVGLWLGVGAFYSGLRGLGEGVQTQS